MQIYTTRSKQVTRAI